MRTVAFQVRKSLAEISAPLISLRKALISALVTSRHEAGPLVVLEAAAVVVPTVGTAVGHVAEWSESAALAVPCQDAVALAHALETVLADDNLRMCLANEARRRAEIEDADHTARAFDEIYRRLVASC